MSQHGIWGWMWQNLENKHPARTDQSAYSHMSDQSWLWVGKDPRLFHSDSINWSDCMDAQAGVNALHNITVEETNVHGTYHLSGWLGRAMVLGSFQCRPTTLAYGKAGACCACSRCGTGGLFFLSPAFSKKSGGTLFSAFRSAWCVVLDF